MAADLRTRSRFLARFPAACADAQDAWQTALLLAYSRAMGGTLAIDQPLDGWLLRTARRVFQNLYEQAQSVLAPVEQATVPCEIAVCRKRRAASAWAAMTEGERRAFEALCDIEDTRSRADVGVFTVRLRLAARRLAA